MMRKALLIFRLAFMERTAYRVNFMLQVTGGILSILIVVFLWLAVYRSSGRSELGGYTLAEMITYLLGAGLINSFLLTTAENPETSQAIQDGTLSNLLLQPFNPYWVWLLRDLAGKLFLGVIGLAGYAIVAFLLREELVLAPDPLRLVLFGAALTVAVLLQFLTFESLSLLAFWVENTSGFRFTMRVIMEVAGGAIIPLSFFPALVQKIFALLPFPYLVYFPMRIYLNKIELAEVLPDLIRAAVWAAGLAGLNAVLWKRGLRRYTAMGD
ncbi:MAG TPA: ABC-2 family transporter protein [Desulfobacterales bacterium]|nr:ABC-2 family transporter protein [Desulfobacterales bacterium]